LLPVVSDRSRCLCIAIHKQRYEYDSIMNSHLPVGASPVFRVIMGVF